jgi:DNA-binding PadR family transcriptional regulator
MSEGAADARRAAADAVAAEPAREEAAAGSSRGKKASGPGGSDPLVGELRRGGLLPLIVLHQVSTGPSYGNQLIDRISELTGGVVSANPNTMYPLLRALEGKGLLESSWEHPERRSRRFYSITDEGRAELDRLINELGPQLDALADAITRIRSEVLNG